LIKNSNTEENFYSNNNRKSILNSNDNNSKTNIFKKYSINNNISSEFKQQKNTFINNKKENLNFNKSSGFLKNNKLNNTKSNNIKDKNPFSKSKNKIITNKSSAFNSPSNNKKPKINEKSFILINDEENINHTQNDNIINNNLNKKENKSYVNNLTEESIYQKRSILLGKYLCNKTGKSIDENSIPTNNILINSKTENINKYINDQENKIGNFDNINLNFSPNRYSRISVSSLREFCDFDLDKRFSNSLSNNDDLFSSEEAKKSLSKKVINPKILLNNMKNQKNNFKIGFSNNKFNLNSTKNSNKKDIKAKIKSFSNSFTKVYGNYITYNNSILNTKKNESQNINNLTSSRISKGNENDRNLNNTSRKGTIKNKDYKYSVVNKTLNNLNGSISEQNKKKFSGKNNLNKSCGDLHNNSIIHNGFQRVISKNSRGKNYYIKTENEELTDKNKKKLYRNYELEIVPINSIILNYKEDVDDSFIRKFKKDLKLPSNFNSEIRRFFNKNKKQKITSKIEKRYFSSIDLSSTTPNFFNKLNRDMYTSYNNSLSSPPKNLLDKISQFKEFKLFKSLSNNKSIDIMNFSPSSERNGVKSVLDSESIFNNNLKSPYSINSFAKSIEKFNKLNELRIKFDYRKKRSLNSFSFNSSPYKNKRNCLNILDNKKHKLNGLNDNNFKESKNLKEIKQSLEILNSDTESNFVKSFKNLKNDYIITELDYKKTRFSPKKPDNLNIDNTNFFLDKNNFKQNRFLPQNNMNFIYDMNDNNFNSMNSLNSFSFHQSPKNKNYLNNTTVNKEGSPLKISHTTVLHYIPDPLTNNVELAEPFQNNIMQKLITKNNLNKTLNNNNEETIFIQNTVNETLSNSIKINKKNLDNNTDNIINTNNINIQYPKEVVMTNNKNNSIRSKSMGRNGKFIPEVFKKFTFGAYESSKVISDKSICDNNTKNNLKNNDYDSNNISNKKKNRLDFSHDDIFINQENDKFEKQFNELRNNIKKLKLNHNVIKSANSLDNPFFYIFLKSDLKKEKMKSKRDISVGKNVNGKIRKLIEENKILLQNNMNLGTIDNIGINENSKSRIKSKYNNSNVNIEDVKFLNTISNIGLNNNNNNKSNTILDNKSRDFFFNENFSENKSKFKKNNNFDILLNNINDNLKNKINKNFSYILSENNISEDHKSYFNKPKQKLEEKLNIYIDNKIEENKEIKSARYTNEKIKEELNKKFQEKLNSQFKLNKINSDEDYKIVLENVKHNDKKTFKDYISSKNKALEQDIQISDEKMSEFKDKFFKNFGKEIERENINSFYKKLANSGNSNSIKDSIVNPISLAKINNKILIEQKPIIEEKVVTRNLERLKNLLNLDEKDSREMKFYNNLNPKYNKNLYSTNVNLVSYSTKNQSNCSNSNKYNSYYTSGSTINDNKNKSYGNPYKLGFNNSSGNSVLPTNDLKLDEIKMKKFHDNHNYKFNF